MLVRKSEQSEYTMKKYGHRFDAIQNEQDLEVTIKSRLNINENAGLNIRVMKCFNCQTSGVVG